MRTLTANRRPLPVPPHPILICIRSTAPTIRRWDATISTILRLARCSSSCRGVPQVYYVGALAGKNDMELLRKTNNGRDINRHYYSTAEIDENL